VAGTVGGPDWNPCLIEFMKASVVQDELVGFVVVVVTLPEADRGDCPLDLVEERRGERSHRCSCAPQTAFEH
jgi:hypothetical protein